MLVDRGAELDQAQRAVRGLTQAAVARAAPVHAGVDLVEGRAEAITRRGESFLRVVGRLDHVGEPASLNLLERLTGFLRPNGEFARRAGFPFGDIVIRALCRFDAGVGDEPDARAAETAGFLRGLQAGIDHCKVGWRGALGESHRCEREASGEHRGGKFKLHWRSPFAHRPAGVAEGPDGEWEGGNEGGMRLRLRPLQSMPLNAP